MIWNAVGVPLFDCVRQVCALIVAAATASASFEKLPANELPPRAVLGWSVESDTPAVLTIGVSPDGKTLATAGHDGLIRFWDTQSGTSRGEIDQHRGPVYAVIYSKDGSRLVSASFDESIQVWNLERLRPERKFHWPAAKLYPCNLAITPDGKTVAAAAGPLIRFWAMDTGEILRTIEVEEHNVLSIAISHDGTRLTSGDGYANVHHWDIETGRDLARLDKPGTLVAYADNAPVLVTRDPAGMLNVWNDTGSPIRTIDIDIEQGPSVSNFQGPLEVSADGKRLAVAVGASVIGVYEMDDGSQAARYTGHSSRITALSFLPSGRIVSAETRGSIIVWRKPDE